MSNKNETKRIQTAAFSMLEALAVILVLFILTGMVIPCSPRAKGKATRIKCTNNLKNLALAARIYATDNRELMPGAYFVSNKTDLASISAADYFRMLSNELSTPKIIACPADKRVKDAASFTNFSNANISYFISLTAQPDMLATFLAGDRNLQLTNGKAIAPGLLTLTTNVQLAWTKELHNEQGNIAMGDGSVQLFSSTRLRSSVRDQDVSTNLLLIP